MKKINDYKRIHFIGIYGVSMSTLAKYSSKFCCVTGSDKCQDEAESERLLLYGINTYVGSSLSVVDNAELVVYSSAVPPTDCELSYACSKGIEMMERCEFLQLVATTCKKTIAIAGTHGKTTTTAMLAHIFLFCKQKFVGHFGGIGNNAKGGFIDTGSDFFITEACEYKKSLLCLTPHIACVLNMEYDHPDSYANLDEIKETFSDFATHAEVWAITSERLDDVDKTKQIFFSDDESVKFNEGDIVFVAKNIQNNSELYSFDIEKNKEVLAKVSLQVYGRYNVANAIAAFGVAYLSGLEPEKIAAALCTFSGVKRRFECIGQMECGARVVEDYAHHPSEIAKCLETAKQVSQGRLIVVFEPHTYSRTKRLFNEFLNCFDQADSLIILPTFAAREKPEAGMSGKELFVNIAQRNISQGKGGKLFYAEGYKEALVQTQTIVKSGDLIMCVGAGSITNLAKSLVKE